MLVEHSDSDRLLDRMFLVSLVMKGLDGVLELVGGAALLVLSPNQIQAAVRAVTRGEFAHDPNDLVANLLVSYADQLNVSLTMFGAIYLLVHGIVKVILVGAVLRDKLWAYPWLIGALVGFISFQLFELARHFTGGLLALTLFDAFIVWLTVREYRGHKAQYSRRGPNLQNQTKTPIEPWQPDPEQ